MITIKPRLKNVLNFRIKKLTALVIVFIALINIFFWITGKIEFLTFNYTINPQATMKIVTSVSFLLIGLKYIVKKSNVFYIFSAGIAIQILQLINIYGLSFFKSSSLITIILFLLSFLVIYFETIYQKNKIVLILNTLVYLISFFCIYYFFIDPNFLANIKGFESISWNTAILFHINSLSSYQLILRKKAEQVYTLNNHTFNLNPFKFFPIYFGVPILTIVIVSILVHFMLIKMNFALFLIFLVLNGISILSAFIFVAKFIKLFNMILKAQITLTENNIRLTEKNKYLEDFASITSHNLKEPIVALNNIVELKNNEIYRDALSNEELDDMLKTNIGNLNKTIDTIYKFLMAIKKGESCNFEYVSISSSFEEQQKNLLDFTTNLEVTVNFKITHNLNFPKVYIDSILYNLLSNSYKYCTPNKPLIITIEDEFDGPNYIIKYKDNGLGIDLKKYGNEIFKPNKRFHKTHLPSTGFGLYFTKIHVEKINGLIHIQSEVNEGTTFILTFKNKKNEGSNN